MPYNSHTASGIPALMQAGINTGFISTAGAWDFSQKTSNGYSVAYFVRKDGCGCKD